MRENATKLLQCTRRLRSDPESADALFTLGVIYAVEGHWAKALKFIRRLEDVKPTYPGLRRLKRRVAESSPVSPGRPQDPDDEGDVV